MQPLIAPLCVACAAVFVRTADRAGEDVPGRASVEVVLPAAGPRSATCAVFPAQRDLFLGNGHGVAAVLTSVAVLLVVVISRR